MKKIILGTSLLCILLAGCENESPSKDATALKDSPPSFLVDRSKVEFVGSCNMETINGQGWGAEIVTPSNLNKVSIGGWFYDEKRHSLADEVYLLFVEEKSRQEFYAISTPVDREIPIGNEVAHAAYEAVLDLSSLPVGDYEALVVASSKGANVMMCANGRRIHR